MKHIFLSFLLLTAGAAGAENILKNGEFNTQRLSGELYSRGDEGSTKVSNITEEGTQNKCLKFEITGIKTYPDGRKTIAAEVVFGKNPAGYGFIAQPDTEYEFSFDIKSALQISLWVSLDSKPAAEAYHSEKRIRPEPRVFKGTADKWTTCRGSFKTLSNTGFMRLHLMLWGDSKRQKTFNYKVGDVVLIDNVKIIKRKANK